MKKKRFLVEICMFIFCAVLLCGIFWMKNSWERKDNIIMDVFPVDICYKENELFFLGKKFGNSVTSELNLYRVRENEEFFIEEVKFLALEENYEIQNITSWRKDIFLVVKSIAEENQYEIWKIHGDDEAKLFCDISKLVGNSVGGVKAVCIDKDGIIYLRCMDGAEIISFNQQTDEVAYISDSSEDVFCESMTVGKNGNVFALFCRNLKAGGGYEIVELANGTKKNVYSGDLLPYDDIYSVMGTGDGEYDVYIKGSKSVYGVNWDRQEITYLTHLELDGFQYTKSCFLQGKQLLIFCMNEKKKEDVILCDSKLLLVDLLKSEVTQ